VHQTAENAGENKQVFTSDVSDAWAIADDRSTWRVLWPTASYV